MPLSAVTGRKITRADHNALVEAVNASTGITGLVTAATRTALAGVNNPSAGDVRLLTEDGREGLFEFTEDDVSDDVTLDTLQGVYVAPDSDDTGASGAWVRKYDGPVFIDWFGAAGDDTTNDGPVFAAAFDFMDRNRTDGVSGVQGAQTLRCGARKYYLGTTQLNMRAAFIFEGAGQRATELRWAADARGIVVQRANTADNNQDTINGTWLSGGDWSTIRQMLLRGAWPSDNTGTEGEYHAIELRARASIVDVEITNWQGDGIHSYAIAATYGENEGNSNSAQMTRPVIVNCRNGIYVEGQDANCWSIIGADLRGNRRWGVLDKSYLGNTYTACHTAGNGQDNAYGPNIAQSRCSYGGQVYSVVIGEGEGASENPPTGTATSNQWWAYNPQGGYATAWTEGQAYQDGGPYCGNNGNARNAWIGCYAEGGQNPSIMTGRDLVIGGLHSECGIIAPSGGDTGANFGAYLLSGNNGLETTGNMTVEGGLYAEGVANFIGSPDAGVSTALTIRSGTTVSIDYVINGYGSAGYLGAEYDAGLTLNSTGGSGRTRLRVNDTLAAEIKATGIDLPTGKVLMVNGTQVVAGQGAAIADVSGGGTVDTEARAAINALLARCRAHGLIAT